jgi:hypothetical protein
MESKPIDERALGIFRVSGRAVAVSRTKNVKRKADGDFYGAG